ncbi:DUF5777 family beta-barrel protein [Ekhidna sp.]|uniref:DUF5777 family beta-barrel protein n=1 Tax=Ekhidna sp. TaxID=2608089 RepID=UPI003BAC45D8
MKKLIQGLLFIMIAIPVMAQDDLLAMVEDEQSDQPTLVEATFKGTRVINGHSIETRKKGVMDFIISHRFGTIDGGSYELFGLDNATVRIGLEYAITDRLYIGLGRSSFEKTIDGFVKYRVLRQMDGAMPISVTWFSSMSIKTLRNPELELSFNEKLASTNQLLIAKKISPNVSVQIMPTWVHKNLIAEEDLTNDAFGVGIGGRVKLSPRLAVVAEYYYMAEKINEDTFNPIAIGLDIETGGHVFQLQFTNATAMVPKGFLSETNNDFFDSEIHFGFNISRTFQINE